MKRRRWQNLFVMEAAGLRTAAAVVVPLILGQIMATPALGLFAGVGGLQVALSDVDGARPSSLLWTIVGCCLAAYVGSLASTVDPVIATMLMFLIAFLLQLLPMVSSVVGRCGFIVLLAYASAQSLPMALHHDPGYIVWFAAGGLWGAFLTLLLWGVQSALERRRGGKSRQWGDGSEPVMAGTAAVADPVVQQRIVPMSWKQAIATHLTYRSPVVHHAFRAATAAAVAVAICHALPTAHSSWLILTVLVVIKPDYALTKQRTFERVVGSVVGGLAAMLLVGHVHDIVMLDVLIVLFGVLAFSHLPRNYGVYVLFLTPFIVLSTSLAVPSDRELALIRIYHTLIGGALGFVVASLLRLPRRWPVGSLAGWRTYRSH